MALVTVYHPELNWSKKTTLEAARVLERSGWQIAEEEDKPIVTGNVVVGASAIITATTPTPPAEDEPTEEEDPSVSSDQPSSEE